MLELRRALEHENATKEIANWKISVASQWIIISGMQLYSEALKSRATVWIPCGEYNLFKGWTHCLERWQFWKLRFSEVKDGVDEEVAKMVQQALKWRELKYHSGTMVPI
jgi:Protein of unknown function (DUF3632)